MKISVRLYGTLRRFSQTGTPGLWVGELPSQSTVLELIYLLGSKPAEVANAVINGEVCPLDTEIPASAEVILVTHMGAG
jgi:molybdopterin converting factor small subunit